MCLCFGLRVQTVTSGINCGGFNEFMVVNLNLHWWLKFEIWKRNFFPIVDYVSLFFTIAFKTLKCIGLAIHYTPSVHAKRGGILFYF